MQGKSCSIIASELGGGISRNAVIGKIHRLGMSGRVTTVKQYKPRGPSINLSKPYKPREKAARPPKFISKPIPQEAPPAPDCAPIDFFAVKDGLCRWPLGDPLSDEFRFCGGKSDLTHSYCPYHARMAYQPAQPRRNGKPKELTLSSIKPLW